MTTGKFLVDLLYLFFRYIIVFRDEFLFRFSICISENKALSNTFTTSLMDDKIRLRDIFITFDTFLSWIRLHDDSIICI